MIDEGVPTLPADEISADFQGVTRAFLGSVYDVKEDNRTKNRIILMLGLILTLQTVGFAFYVMRHARIHVRVVDTNLAENIPFRVLAFDTAVGGHESLYRYFFGLITNHLFTYDKDSIIANRRFISHFLSPKRIKGLQQDTNALIADYERFGRFPKGNPTAAIRNILFLDQDSALKTIQVFADITLTGENGEDKGLQRYLITYKFRNIEPKTREAVTQNPLGIMVTEWTIQKTQGDSP
ncbi:MAG: VirB8/TrbF family protein [Acidobacteriota bacterium]|nr:VirB8/TrbF family protein [Acidobacteriota bacterium]